MTTAKRAFGAPWASESTRLPQHGGHVRLETGGHIGACFRKKCRVAVARKQAIERALRVRLKVRGEAPEPPRMRR